MNTGEDVEGLRRFHACQDKVWAENRADENFQNIWKILYALPNDVILRCYCEGIQKYWHPCLGVKPDWWVNGKIDDRQKKWLTPVEEFVSYNLGSRESQRYMYIHYYRICSQEEFDSWWKAGVPHGRFLDHAILRRPSGIS